MTHEEAAAILDALAARMTRGVDLYDCFDEWEPEREAISMAGAALREKHDAEQAAIVEDFGQTAPKSWSP